MTMETAKKTTHRPARKSWVYGILLVMFLGVVVYFGLMNIQDRSKNQDYYRVLYEASNMFIENLHQLESMHKYEESATSIRSLLPSYSRTPFTKEEKSKRKLDKSETDYVSDLGYVLNGKQLKYISEDFSASLLIEDILPTPKKGFSQYLFADEGGNVLAPIGGERTISIVDLSSINQEIQRKNKQFQFNLTDAKQGQLTGQPAPLPSYSNHVDMKISYGEFRVYVFPFRLNTPLRNKTDAADEDSTLNNLYLVGLLPKHELTARDSGHWNVSLLVVTIISLLFMWSMLRLYLLPKNQAITKTYRVIANLSSYLFFIVIVALVLAYFQKSLLQNMKDLEVVKYADKLNQDITADLFDIFSGLNNHRQFYLAILNAFEDPQVKLGELKNYTVTDTLITDISAVVNQEITHAQTSGKLNKNTILEGIKTAIDKELKQLQVFDAEKKEALVKNIFEVVNNEFSISQTPDTGKQNEKPGEITETVSKEDALLRVITETVNKELLPLYRLDPKTREKLVTIFTQSIREGITEVNFLQDIDELTVNKLNQFPDLNVVGANTLRADINQAVFNKLMDLPDSDKVKKKTFAIEIVNVFDNEFKKLFISKSQKKEMLVNVINQDVFDNLETLVNSDNPNIQTNLPLQYFHMGSAATSKWKYSLAGIAEDEEDEDEDEQDKDIPLRLDVDAISVLVNAVKINKAGVNTLDFFSQLQTVNFQPNESLETYISKVPKLPLKNKLLSVFAMNGEGNLILPSFYYQESNSLPETYSLSHRNYFKQVRDHKGWDLKLTSKTTQSYENIYIQRLLNLNNGTRGTTVSMPMNDLSKHQSEPIDNDHIKDQSERIGNDHIIAADVLLPSLSLRESPLYDFTYMIVERSSGEVLFHKDTERSLVENLYFSGDSGNRISQKIKAGLKQHSDIDNGLFSGSYHGQKGRFALSPTIVNEWAIVIFYPDDTLQALMTNQFLFISVSFALTMALMMLVIYAIRYKIWTSALKEKLALPFKLNIRFVMLVSSVMLSTSYCLHLLGANIDLLYKPKYFSILLPLIGIVLTTVLVYLGCTKLFSFPPDVSDELTRLKSKRGAIGIIFTVLIITCAHFYYIHKTSTAQLKSLYKYYQQLECVSLNYERAELNSMVLSRYPQSITAKRIDPLLLLPLQDHWYKNLRGSNSDCDNQFAASSNPEGFPSMGSLTGSTGVWRWINNFLWTETNEETPEKYIKAISDQHLPIFNTVLQGFLLITIIWLWFKFNTRILWHRLYCPERFMQHITRMTESVRSLETEAQNKQLRIECDSVKLNGVGLNLLLRSMSLNTSDKPKPEKRVLVKGFTKLFEMSPCLQSFSQDKSVLPNLKLNLDSDPTSGLLNVQIWDIETCLEKGDFRQLLLELIMELKSLTVANQLHSFTIFAGFHSLQRVKMKDPLSQDNSSLLATAEYLSWSECLMDFVVVLPDSFKRDVDWELLESEVEAFPELKYLVEPYDEPEQKNNWLDVLKRDEELYQESNWATINYLLLNADALYRFKWESCSSAEKLALINLAKQNRINPMNTQMIEHLALNGLITVRKGHLDIVNRSFAHFVLHAETSATLNQLVSYGEAGIWKNYKLPIGIMILLIIGGIALTSGESIYIIAASMAGVLGTVVSVTNSANMLRGGPKD